jgi:hypothetical protein
MCIACDAHDADAVRRVRDAMHAEKFREENHCVDFSSFLYSRGSN